ncbi:hypothetical protein [Actinomadura flavalba]|uniref:hypothetical protein n=1 Tax=Actinomadura flavalba TaxID=1120938 RepID=UPI000372BD83|nr:hypothetical protein [Actinomadura flavalba]
MIRPRTRIPGRRTVTVVAAAVAVSGLVAAPAPASADVCDATSCIAFGDGDALVIDAGDCVIGTHASGGARTNRARDCIHSEGGLVRGGGAQLVTRQGSDGRYKSICSTTTSDGETAKSTVTYSATGGTSIRNGKCELNTNTTTTNASPEDIRNALTVVRGIFGR